MSLDRELGEIVATQKAMKEKLDSIELSVNSMISKVYTGKGIILGVSAVSGCVGGIVAGLLAIFKQ